MQDIRIVAVTMILYKGGVSQSVSDSLSKVKLNIAKGTTDPRVEFISQVAHKS